MTVSLSKMMRDYINQHEPDVRQAMRKAKAKDKGTGRPIRTMTEKEMRFMQRMMLDFLGGWADSFEFSGLSHAGWFDYYTAIEDAIEKEWTKSQKVAR